MLFNSIVIYFHLIMIQVKNNMKYCIYIYSEIESKAKISSINTI